MGTPAGTPALPFQPCGLRPRRPLRCLCPAICETIAIPASCEFRMRPLISSRAPYGSPSGKSPFPTTNRRFAPSALCGAHPAT